jgi:hypothetical protein
VTIVATATSRRGGLLDCGHRARPGDLIHKIDVGDRGSQTSYGNGRGGWICSRCAAQLDPDAA